MIILASIATWLFGIWVFSPLFALETASASGGTWQAQLRKLPRNLFLFWAFFAFWRLCLLIAPAPALLQFIPEPLSTTVFLWMGAGSLVLWLVVAVQGRRQVLQGTDRVDGSRGAFAFPQRSASRFGTNSRAR